MISNPNKYLLLLLHILFCAPISTSKVRTRTKKSTTCVKRVSDAC